MSNVRTTRQIDDVSVFQLLESLPDPAFLIRPDGLVLSTNTLFCSRFGKSPEEFIGRQIRDLIIEELKIPALWDYLRKETDKVLQTGMRSDFEDDTDIWKVAINPIKEKDGSISALFFIVQDIARKKQADRLLKKDQEMKSALLDSIPCSAVILDADLQLTAWNRYAQEMLFDKTGEDQATVHPAEFFNPDQMETLREKFLHLLQTGADDVSEMEVRPHGGAETVWMLTRSNRIFIEGKPCIVSIGIDITERKQLEQALERSKAQLNLSLQAAHAGVWEWQPSTNRVDWSAELWQLYGIDQAGNTPELAWFEKVLHPDDRIAVVNQIRDAAANGLPVDVEYRVIRQDGSVRWVMSRGNALDEDRYIGTIIDITDRKRLEQALTEKQRRMGMSLEAARAGIWEWDPRTGENEWSDEIWPIYGLEKGNNKPSFELWASTIHPDDRQMAIDEVSKATMQKTELNVEYRILDRDGSIRWLMSRGMPAFDEDGSLVRYTGTIIDITERKQLEQKLLESKFRYSFALDAAHAGIWEWNLKTDELAWSEQVWRLYGLEPDSVHLDNQLCVATVHPDDRDEAARIIREAVANLRSASIEYRTVHPDGSVRWLTSRGMPLRNADGEVTRYIGTIIDITERKQVELELLESKRRFTFALEATNSGVWEWDVKGDKVTWTDSIWKLYGLKPDSMKPSHRLCETNIHEDDRDAAFEHVMAAASRNQEVNVEYRVVHRNGSIHWLLCRGVPLKGDDGRTSCYLGTVTEITERKRMEETLRKNQAKFNFILEKSRIGVWDLNIESGKVHRSKEHAGIFGYENAEDEWSLQKLLDHIVPEDRKRVETLIRNAFDSHESYTFECRIRSAQGKIRWIWMFGAFEIGSDGKPGHVSGIVQDVTERKRTELLLKENELKFRNVFEFSPVAIGIANAGDNCLFDVNPSWLRLFGQSREKVIGHCISDLGVYEDKADHGMILGALHEQGRIINLPLQLRKSDGEPMNVLLSAEYVTFSGTTNLLMMMTDITIQELQQASISQLEEAVAERTEQLRQEVERLHRFLSMISHEYRTPLAIIRGNLDLIDLKHQSGNFSNTREMLKIKRAIDRLVEVMEVSIQESRILESKKTDMAMRLSIAPILSSQLEAFRSMWPERQVDYTDMGGDAAVQGEAAQLKIALFNLLDNARKYSSKDTPIEVRGSVENGMAVVSIRNEGGSLTKEDEEACFEKYRRGSNASNTAGAGLGLWLVRDIVSQHGGRVTLERIESGVEATITLPLAAGSPTGFEPDSRESQ